MQVIVDGMMTHYTREGKGPLLLVLPGWADSSKGWLTTQKLLAGSFDTVVLDLPGFGDSQAPAVAWGLTEYAAFVGAFIQKIDAAPLHAVIGHSNGGAIAIRGIARQNFSAQRLVLLASAGIRNPYNGKTKAVRLITKTGKLMTLALPSSLKQRLRKKVYSTIGSDMLVAEHMQETFKKIVNDDVRSDVQAVSIPTLLLYGDKDTQTPVMYGQTYHQLLANSTLEVVPGAEHFLHLEQPDKVVGDIRKFLQS